MRLRLAMVALWWAVATLVASPVVAAEESERLEKKKSLPRRAVKLERKQKWVVMTAEWHDVVDKKIRRKLLSGLPTTIVSRAYVYRSETSKKPISLSIKTCRVVYDLWDEVFRIELRQGGRKRTTAAVNVDGVLRRCAQTKRLALTPLASLAPDAPHFVAMLVEVNPLSEKMLEKIKRWVARPQGAAVGPGDSLFGSFVGLFVTQVPAADRVLMFRSPPFLPRDLPAVPKKKQKKESGDGRPSG